MTQRLWQHKGWEKGNGNILFQGSYNICQVGQYYKLMEDKDVYYK